MCVCDCTRITLGPSLQAVWKINSGFSFISFQGFLFNVLMGVVEKLLKGCFRNRWIVAAEGNGYVCKRGNSVRKVFACLVSLGLL